MNIKQKIGAAIATGALLAATMMPVAAHAATNTVTVTGGGAFSTKIAGIFSLSTKSVTQGNTTVAVTNVNAGANTGFNSASFNTGGATSIGTGAAANSVSTSVGGSGNLNTGCGCPSGSTNTVSLTGGGAFSTSIAGIVDISSSTVNQTNSTTAVTNVNTVSNTGGNSASFNTGGSTGISTGTASNSVSTSVTGSSNVNN